jgi:hypothetical protein
MKLNGKNRTVPDAKPLAPPKPATARGSRWKKFDFGRGQGLKVWQVMDSAGRKPTGY